MNFFGRKKEKGDKASSASKNSKETNKGKGKASTAATPAATSKPPEDEMEVDYLDNTPFDENDPALLEELAALDLESDDDDNGGSRGGGSKVAMPPSRRAPAASTNTGAEADDDEHEAPHDMDMGDKDLLAELGHLMGQPHEEEQQEEEEKRSAAPVTHRGGAAPPKASTREAVSAGLEDDHGGSTDEGGDDHGGSGGGGGGGDSDVDDDELHALVSSELEEDGMSFAGEEGETEGIADKREAVVKPTGGGREEPASSDASFGTSEIQQLEAEVGARKQNALELKKSGDKRGALEAMRSVKRLEQELGTRRKLDVVGKVSNTDTVVTVSPSPKPPPLPVRPAATYKAAKLQPKAKNEIDVLREAVERHKTQALQLKREGRNAEALVQMKRAKSIQMEVASKVANANANVNNKLNRSSGTGHGSYRPAARRVSLGPGGAGIDTAGGPSRRASTSSSSGSGALAEAAGAVVRVANDQSSFTVFEQALTVARESCLQRAKQLATADKAAAEVELAKYKAFKEHLAKLKEARTIPGALPPPWHWEIRKKSRIRVLSDVGKDEIKFEFSRVTGLSEKLKGKGGSVWLMYDLCISKDQSVGTGMTKEVKVDDDEADFNFSGQAAIRCNAKSTHLAFSHRKAHFEVVARKGGMFNRGSEVIARALLPLSPLLTTCQIETETPLLSDSRRPIGGHLSVTISLQKPLQADEVTQTEEKELIIGEWFSSSSLSSSPSLPAPPAVAVPLTRPSTQSVDQFSSSSSPTIAKSNNLTSPQAVPLLQPRTKPGASPVAAAVPVQPKQQQQQQQQQQQRQQQPQPLPAATAPTGPDYSLLTEDQKAHPLAPTLIISNDVFEAEIADIDRAGSAVAAPGSQLYLRRLTLEKLLYDLVSMVQDGQLQLDEYCDMLREAMKRDKLLALYLMNNGRVEEAKAVIRRVRIMEKEEKNASAAAEGGDDGDGDEGR